jgi:hypothetical protein
MKINPILYGVLVVAVFFGIIGGFQVAGLWSTSGKISAGGEAIQPEADDVNSIKGWMTLEQISSTYHVSVGDLLSNFNLPVDTSPSTPIKDLESDTFTTTALREWLSSKNTSTEVKPSITNTTPTPEETTVVPDISITTSPTGTDSSVTLRTITGKTTFQELIDWGVQVQAIERIIGNKLPDPSLIIKDYVTSQGMEFLRVKSNLQEEVNSLK